LVIIAVADTVTDYTLGEMTLSRRPLTEPVSAPGAHPTRGVRVVGFALLALLALAVLWRTFVGVGTWGDEPYALATPLRYHLGDRPLVDSWDTNFSSALLVCRS
jgi:hypothetical protein